MKITLSPLVSALRGRAGSTVAAVCKGVNYIKAHARPGGPPSQAQLDHRAHLARQATLWRSLPDNIRAFLDVLGAEQGITGFALYTKNATSHHSVEYDPTIVPENHFFGVAPPIECYEGMYPGDVQIFWDLHAADPTAWFHFFTCLYDFDDIKKHGPDRWTHYPTKVTPMPSEYACLEGLELGLDYWLVGVVAKKQTLAENTVLSGGSAAVANPFSP